MIKELLYGSPPFSENTVNNSRTIYKYLDVIVNIPLFRARHLNLDGQFKCLENRIEGIAQALAIANPVPDFLAIRLGFSQGIFWLHPEGQDNIPGRDSALLATANERAVRDYHRIFYDRQGPVAGQDSDIF